MNRCRLITEIHLDTAHPYRQPKIPGTKKMQPVPMFMTYSTPHGEKLADGQRDQYDMADHS